MDFQEYSDRQLSITQELVERVLRIILPFRSVQLTVDAWFSLLDAIFDEVLKSRTESAKLGREFYDSQREQFYPGTRHDLDLAEYSWASFINDMEPARQGMSEKDATDEAVSQLALRIAKVTENAGRKTILRPVTSEKPEDRDPVLVGWARVATGRETCGFCLMMVSRGPAYFSAEDAGMNLDDTSALELIEEGDDEAIKEAMKRWHPGCDCKAVPVFDRKNWEGRDAYLRAEKLWMKATSGYSGKDALNAFRRAVERGDVNAKDFAAAA